KAAAAAYASKASPTTLRWLSTQAATNGFGGAAQVCDRLDEGRFHLEMQSQDPAYLQVLASRGVTISLWDRVRAARSTEDLMSVAPEVAELRPSATNLRSVAALLLQLAVYPEATGHWAVHGGDMGRLCAYLDPRYDYTGVVDRFGFREDESHV